MKAEVIELRYGNTNCFCVNRTLMVDTDWAGTLPALLRCAKARGVDLRAVKYMLVTHFHPDHMGLAGELAELGITTVVFEEQRGCVHASDGIFTQDRRVSFRPIDERTVRYLTLAESRSFLAELGIAGEVIHTPHHSVDSVSLILDEGAAFVGDLYPLATLPGFDDAVLEAIWERILAFGVDRIYYGHAATCRINPRLYPSSSLDEAQPLD